MDAGTVSELVVALWTVATSVIGVLIGGVIAWVNLKRDVREAQAAAAAAANHGERLTRLEAKHDSTQVMLKAVAEDVRWLTRNALVRNGARTEQDQKGRASD